MIPGGIYWCNSKRISEGKNKTKQDLDKPPWRFPEKPVERLFKGILFFFEFVETNIVGTSTNSFGDFLRKSIEKSLQNSRGSQRFLQ